MATTRYTSGVSQSALWQSLGGIGVPDPFFYDAFIDDFLPFVPALYTITAAGGSIAGTPGPGGRILFTTGSTPGNFAALQNTSASFQYVPGKRLAFLCRLQLADNINPYGVVGLIQTTATPNTVTNGWYFSKAPGGSVILFSIVNASTTIASITVGNVAPANTDVDLGFDVDFYGNTRIFVGFHVEGRADENLSTLGPVAKILNTSLTGTLPTTLLNPTMSLTTITSATTGIADFLYAAQER